MQFKSPFVNLWLKPDDYIKLLQSLDYYISSEVTFIEEAGINYPIRILGHDVTEKDAYEAWEDERSV